jgi:hypothetical protein
LRRPPPFPWRPCRARLPNLAPVAYIAAPAEAPACPSSPCPAPPPSHAVRRNREAPPPAVLHPPAREPTGGS